MINWQNLIMVAKIMLQDGNTNVILQLYRPLAVGPIRHPAYCSAVSLQRVSQSDFLILLVIQSSHLLAICCSLLINLAAPVQKLISQKI